MDKCELKTLLIKILENEKTTIGSDNHQISCDNLNELDDYVMNICLPDCNSMNNCENNDDCCCDNEDKNCFNRCKSNCNNSSTYIKKNKEYIDKLINKETGLDFYGRLNRIRKNINTENHCNKNTYFEDKTDTRIISITGCCANNEDPPC